MTYLMIYSASLNSNESSVLNKNDNFVSAQIIAININKLPKIILRVITSFAIITEKIIPNIASVDSNIAVLVSSTLVWHIVWPRKHNVVLNTPKNSTDPIVELFIVVLNSPTKNCNINDNKNAVAICMHVSTIGSWSFVNSLVKNICIANPTAHINVRPSPKLMLKSDSSDIIPIPTSAIKLLIIPIFSTFLLYKMQPTNGTITTFAAVKNALLAEVVYFNPNVWKEKAINKNIPSNTPEIISFLFIIKGKYS